MKMNQLREYNSYDRRKKQKFLWTCVIIIVLAVAFAAGVSMRTLAKHKELSKELSLENLENLWNSEDYEGVYAQADRMLEEKPMQQSVLVYKGYSAFYLAVSQTDTSAALAYIEDAINALRLALISNYSKSKPQIEYMLARAYYQKDVFAAYNCYADLAIKYFTLAKNDGYVSNDIPEYLGLSYAALNMTEESISAFTEALGIHESEKLLHAIGEQYYKSEDYSKAKQYLFRVVSESNDDILVLKSRNILGKIYLEENNLFDAKREFDAILAKDANYADAYYGLGIIYEKQGDSTKARSEWRKALRVQVNHPGALQKLNNG